jgi:hypothetical protein
MTRLALLALAAVLAAAGCVTTPTGDDGSPPAQSCELGPYDEPQVRLLNTTDDPIVDDKALQWDFEAYAARTCSLPAIGWSALSPDGTPHTYIGEIDMRGDLDLGAVAVLGNGESPRVYLVDISDRANPVVVSAIDQQFTYITDVKISGDGKALYTASQGSPLSGAAEIVSNPEAASGFTLYNIEEPADPQRVTTVTDASNGCHMLSAVQVAPTQDALFCIGQTVRSYLVERSGPVNNLGFVDYRPAPSGPAAPQAPHDMTPYHEGDGFGDGASYMVVSHWGEGVKVLDITNAPVVTEVGSWSGQGATHYAGNVHTAMMFDVGDDRYIVASPEYTSQVNAVPSLWLLDANDLSDLRFVGEWYHPNEHPSQGLYLTTHQWQVAPTGPDVNASEVRVYLTYNHGGLWVLDFSKMLEKDLQGAILGFNAARTPLDQDEAVSNAILSTWDVNVVDGYIYGSDRGTGLWVFHYADDELGDQRLTGFA